MVARKRAARSLGTRNSGLNCLCFPGSLILRTPSSWEIRFSGDLGECNVYSQEMVLTVPVNSAS